MLIFDICSFPQIPGFRDRFRRINFHTNFLDTARRSMIESVMQGKHGGFDVELCRPICTVRKMKVPKEADGNSL